LSGLTKSQQAVYERYAGMALAAASGGRAPDCGCGRPLDRAELGPGEAVLDLGCGAGGEVIEAACLVGPDGQAFGLDMAEEMLALAAARVAESGLGNIRLLSGLLEDIPLPDASVDVVISNCVINLSDDKRQALREARRVLRPHGRLCVTDIVLADPGLDAETRRLTAPILGCTNGVLGVEEYLDALDNAGFSRPAVDIYRPYAARTLLDLAKQQGAVAALAHLSSTERKRSIDNAFAAAYITGYR